MTDRNRTVVCCEEYGRAFAAWDLRLYLDTHPTDTQALALFAQMCGDMNGDCYACRGIAPCSYEDGIWHYPDGPWPWEADANCKVESAGCGKGGR